MVLDLNSEINVGDTYLSNLQNNDKFVFVSQQQALISRHLRKLNMRFPEPC